MKKIGKRQIITISSLIIPLIAVIMFDRWLPYALLSHYKFPVVENPPILKQYGASAETLAFKTKDNINISGWFIPAKTPSKKTLIVLHSRGATRQDMLEFSLPLWQAGFNLALIDMRGHGRSGSDYFTFGYYEWQDVSGLIDDLERRHPNVTNDITLIGVSAGGAVAISAASKEPRIKRLVTVASFADLTLAIKQQVPWLPEFWRSRAIKEAEQMGKFSIAETSPLNKIQQIKCPVLIIHGAKDTYIPFEDGKKLFSKAVGKKQFYAIPEATHANMLLVDSLELKRRIIEFITISRPNETSEQTSS